MKNQLIDTKRIGPMRMFALVEDCRQPDHVNVRPGFFVHFPDDVFSGTAADRGPFSGCLKK
jgi:hypothetical protein